MNESLKKEYEKKFVKKEDIGTPLIGIRSMSVRLKSEFLHKEIWDFIETAITKAREEEREKILSKVEPLQVIGGDEYYEGYNYAIKDVIELLTQDKKVR